MLRNFLSEITKINDNFCFPGLYIHEEYLVTHLHFFGMNISENIYFVYTII